MTDATAGQTPDGANPSLGKKSLLIEDDSMRRRNAAEKRFRVYGIAAILIGVAALVILVISILGNGLSSFRQTYVTIPIVLTQEAVDEAEASIMRTGRYADMIESALQEYVAEQGIEVEGISEDEIGELVSGEAAAQFREFVINNPSVIGTPRQFEFLANGRIDGFFKGRVSFASAELDGNVTPAQLTLADELRDAGGLETRFNWNFLVNPDASDTRPEAAGLGVAILGSAYMMLVVLCLALPIGVAASIYLEEFAPKNRVTDVIEVNISNLAAVPSIVYGILGLAIFINFAGLPQSAPIVGGLVLTLMTLPTIIIATRSALKAVPPSIRDAALGVGASRLQTVFHHVLPLAAPGILTGTIIGLAQALGETAPLLLIGMVAFVREYPAAPPEGLFDPASALPVQVYNWTQRSDPAFVERASGAIIVLLIFLLIMNLTAIFLRRRFERRW